MRRTLIALAACAALPAPAAMNPLWTQPVEPHVIYGNTYFVGSKGLASILITSPQGHVLIDATLSGNAALVEANILKLGFRVEDIKLILNSHPHFDHAAASRHWRRTAAPRCARLLPALRNCDWAVTTRATRSMARRRCSRRWMS